MQDLLGKYRDTGCVNDYFQQPQMDDLIYYIMLCCVCKKTNCTKIGKDMPQCFAAVGTKKQKGYRVMKKERLLQRFFQYITCSSESLREREFCLMMEDELRTLGITVQRQEIGEPIGSNGWNIHARLPGTGEPLLLCAHLDTALPGKGIVPTVRGGTVYSEGDTVLGADSKAGIAAVMEALQTIVESGIPHRPVELLLTLCGENDLLGSRFTDQQTLTAAEAVVLTDDPLGYVGDRGAACVKYRFEIKGAGARTGDLPETGVHALRTAADCVTRLRCGHVSPDSVVGIANLLCPGQTGTVPARASFEVAICSYDEEELRALSDEAVQTVETTCAEQGAQCTSERSCVAPAYRIPADAPLLRRVCRGLTELGCAPAIGQPLRCSDAAWLAEGGRTAIEIGVGVQNAHSCGEHILFEDIALTTELLLKLLTE